MTRTVTAHGPDELVAAVPIFLGFNPSESLIVVPIAQSIPMAARLDLPQNAAEREAAAENLAVPLSRHVTRGAIAAVVCVSEDRRLAEQASRHMADRLESIGIGVLTQVWANSERWVELTTGATGVRTTESASRMTAEAVMAGRPRPAATREALAASMVGDRDPVARELPAAVQAAERSTPIAERNWAIGRLEQFHADGARLSDPDAARLLAGLKSHTVRDALWEDMSRDNANTHIALWSDMTRRAPDEVRAPAATLLAFSSWLQGNGAQAWCALDQIPPGESYSMASLVATALQEGISPDTWEQFRATGAASESYTPTQAGRPGHRPGRDAGGPGLDGPGLDGPAPSGPRR